MALRAAEESLVLLKNDNGLLPLALSRKGVAFIGPHANATQAMLSNYHGKNSLVNSHSPLQAATAAGVDVTYAKGCNICDTYTFPGEGNMPCPAGKANDVSGIPAAVALATTSSVAVLFLGSDQTTEAENFDRSSITLTGVQEQLLAAVLEVQPNTVVVLIHGGPIASTAIKGKATSVLEAFYPGELGGDAIVNTLFGKNNPSGRMPYTTYHSNFTGRDVREMDLRANGGVTYRWFAGPVLWPFGFGLSYSSFTFEWSDATRGTGQRAVQIGTATTIDHTVTVTNTGQVAGDCVALAFVVAVQGSPPDTPLKKLFGFERLRDIRSAPTLT